MMEKENNTIFDLMESNQAKHFIEKAEDLELEVGATIAEQFCEFPYIGSLLKLGKVIINYMDYRFLKKLGLFMKNAHNISFEKKQQFINSLSNKEKKRISDYLTQLLYSAEEDTKAVLMGEIYRRRLLGEIDTDMMLRLCSIVNRAYIYDLKHLEEYVEVTDANSFITDNLVALGLLADLGNIYNESEDGIERTLWGPTKHVLNEIGLSLYQIMKGIPVNVGPIARITGPSLSLGPMSKKEIEGIISKAKAEYRMSFPE